jgi:hypothetical protein
VCHVLFLDVLMMRLFFSYGALDFLFRPVVVLLQQGNSPSFYMYCLGISFPFSLVRIHAFILHLSKHAHTLA